MADNTTSEVIRYVIEVDEAGAKAKITKLFADAMGGGAGGAVPPSGSSFGGSGGGGGHTVEFLLRDILLAVRSIASFVGTGSSRTVNYGGVTNVSNVASGGNRLPVVEAYLFDILLKVHAIAAGSSPPGTPHRTPPGINKNNQLMERLIATVQAAAIGQQIASGNMGGAIGTVGTMVGGKGGLAISSIGAAAQAITGLAESLKDYNATLFGTLTGFDMFLEGFKFKLAADLAGPLSELMHKLMELAVAMEPVVVELTKLATQILEPVIDLLIKLGQTIVVVIDAMKVLVAWVDTNFGGDGKSVGFWYTLLHILGPDSWATATEAERLHDLLGAQADLKSGERSKESYQGFLDDKIIGKYGDRLSPKTIELLRQGKGYNEAAAELGTGSDLPAGLSKEQREKALSAAQDELAKSMKNLTGAIGENTRTIQEWIALGQAITQGLFRSFEQFGKSHGNDFGLQQRGLGQFVPDIPGIEPKGRFWMRRDEEAGTGEPSVNDFIDHSKKTANHHNWKFNFAPAFGPKNPLDIPNPNGRNPAAQFVDRNKNQITPDMFPRPSPAAMHFHTADAITVNASDYDRLHTELMHWQNRIWEAMHGMQTQRWMRLARARYTLG